MCCMPHQVHSKYDESALQTHSALQTSLCYIILSTNKKKMSNNNTANHLLTHYVLLMLG